jgi:hypothetical protein
MLCRVAAVFVSTPPPPPHRSYAVVSDKEQYLGIITRETLVKQFGSFMI